ncbi:MAG: rhodanese-like domain-containing protein [Bacteroidales bacterium]|jgi:rhodanese-related sulfurtransferase|nr:rhodanese-like domain-containing protein [Bacteroidales bacterium]
MKHPNLNFIAFVVTFILVIVIGLLTLNWPDLEYKRSLEETVEVILQEEDLVYPEDLVMIVEYEEPGYAIIDLRSPYDYIKGHINGAVNIPVNSILDKENLKTFNQYVTDSVTVVFYGKDQLEANGPWMILKQIGFDNIKVLMGGYHYFTTGPLDIYDMPEIPAYLVEEPAYDFYGTMEEMGSADLTGGAYEPQTEVVTPTRRKKASVVEGGC